MLPRDEVVDHNVECELRDENCEKRREQSGLEDDRREGEGRGGRGGEEGLTFLT